MAETKPHTEPTADSSAEGQAESTHQSDGRYIPYSGGSLGWYENTGVPARERGNNYAFHKAIDGEVVRAKQYLRAALRSEKRRSARRIVQEEMLVGLHTSKETKTARVFDISKHGMRAQYIGDDIQLRPGEKVQVRFQGKEGGLLLELTCTVVRAWKAGRTRTLWNFGLDFPLMKDDQLTKLIAVAGLSE